ncbi:MAG: formimidoylglutamate deiminase [Burkholderiales bacterium]
MTRRLHASWALLPTGWERDVAIAIAADGRIEALDIGVARGASEDAGGPVIPAMPNVHSHAFQRAVAGRTGHAGASCEDSFWTWRQSMYRFIDRLDPDAFEAIAAQAYVEMLKSGYGAVAEFHYLHRDPKGRRYANPAEMSERVLRAARDCGIGLTLLPVYYAHGGFGRTPPSPEQRRMLTTTDEFSALVAGLAPQARDAGAVLGVAPHSLRATTPEEIDAVLAVAPSPGPVHIHVAEQTREVEECVAWSGKRPVEWLLERHPPDERWCYVHATHMTEAETRALAGSGAVAGLAPTTEADLGDGTFPAVLYTSIDGRWGVGSDSNAIVDPFVELRQLEYSQRLVWRRRNLLHHGSNDGIGTSLWLAAAAGGARACAIATGAIEPGCRADLVVLDASDPGLCGHGTATLLDAAIFGPSRAPVRHVMVAGAWRVRDGRHPREESVLARFRDAVAANTLRAS